MLRYDVFLWTEGDQATRSAAASTTSPSDASRKFEHSTRKVNGSPASSRPASTSSASASASVESASASVSEASRASTGASPMGSAPSGNTHGSCSGLTAPSEADGSCCGFVASTPAPLASPSGRALRAGERGGPSTINAKTTFTIAGGLAPPPGSVGPRGAWTHTIDEASAFASCSRAWSTPCFATPRFERPGTQRELRHGRRPRRARRAHGVALAVRRAS